MDLGRQARDDCILRSVYFGTHYLASKDRKDCLTDMQAIDL